MHLFSEVFDLKPTRGLRIGWINVAQESPDDPKAAKRRRTPRRKREFRVWNGGYVSECGGAPPLFKGVLGYNAYLV